MSKLMSTKYSDTTFSLGIFLLRLTAGGLMIPHGYMKLQKFQTFVSQFPDPFHVGARISLSLSIFAELFCAGFIVLGLFTRLATIPLIINMAVALMIAHKGKIFTDGEMATLFLGMFLTLLFTGPGKFSLDKIIGK